VFADLALKSESVVFMLGKACFVSYSSQKQRKIVILDLWRQGLVLMWYCSLYLKSITQGIIWGSNIVFGASKYLFPLSFKEEEKNHNQMFHQMLLMNQFMLEINPSFDLSINCD
jgi:hypothetical protein